MFQPLLGIFRSEAVVRGSHALDQAAVGCHVVGLTQCSVGAFVTNEPTVFEPREDDADTSGFELGGLADHTLGERLVGMGSEVSHDGVGVRFSTTASSRS